MKNILIAASVVAAAGAGLILYLRKRDTISYKAGDVVDAASKAYKNLNDNMGRIDRPAQHAMG
ncbi:MAG: hypothetical protein ACM3VS_05450 [Candidatus Dadabacteria bacterium]